MQFSNANVFIRVKDYSVSKESFDLLLDEELQLLKTHPQPTLENLPGYYESEDYISHTDGKRSLFEKMYHIIKRKAIRDKVKLIAKFQSKKGNLLDIGAGTGDFLLEAKNQQWNITGIEPNNKAKAIAISKGLKFSDRLENLADHSFDAITMWHVLEHVPDLEYQLNELKRLLKPDGVLIVAVPNFKSYDAHYFGKFWAAYDVPRHLWHFSKKSIALLFSRVQMELIKIEPMYFDSFYVSLLSEKYKNGKMNFFKGFWIGLLSNIKASQNFEYSSHIYILKNRK